MCWFRFFDLALTVPLWIEYFAVHLKISKLSSNPFILLEIQKAENRAVIISYLKAQHVTSSASQNNDKKKSLISSLVNSFYCQLKTECSKCSQEVMF